MAEIVADPAPSDQYVQSLARGLSVIEAFGADHPEMTLSEVAAATGLTRAAARRFLLTLVELGFARQRDGRFALTPRVLRLGTAYLSGLGLPEIAQPHLERLSAEVDQSTNAAVLDGSDVVYVTRAAKRRIMTVAITVGTRFPAFATSLGRVLLAALPPEELDAYFATADLTPPTERALHDEAGLRRVLARVRKQGYAVSDQQLAAGLRSIAVPVTGRAGRVVAAVNVSTAASRTTLEAIRRDLVPSLLATAARISADLPAAARRVS